MRKNRETHHSKGILRECRGWEPNPRCNIRTWRKTSIHCAPATGQEWGESFTNLYSLLVDLYACIFVR